jgi:hypothetical protein
MRRTDWMYVNRCCLREPPGRAGVVEMNVTQENVANVRRLEARFPKIDNHIVERRFRSGIEQRDSVASFECSRSDDAGVAELARIQYVNFHRLIISSTPSQPSCSSCV